MFRVNSSVNAFKYERGEYTMNCTINEFAGHEDIVNGHARNAYQQRMFRNNCYIKIRCELCISFLISNRIICLD